MIKFHPVKRVGSLIIFLSQVGEEKSVVTKLTPAKGRLEFDGGDVDPLAVRVTLRGCLASHLHQLSALLNACKLIEPGDLVAVVV